MPKKMNHGGARKGAGRPPLPLALRKEAAVSVTIRVPQLILSRLHAERLSMGGGVSLNRWILTKL